MERSEDGLVEVRPDGDAKPKVRGPRNELVALSFEEGAMAGEVMRKSIVDSEFPVMHVLSSGVTAVTGMLASAKTRTVVSGESFQSAAIMKSMFLLAVGFSIASAWAMRRVLPSRA